MKSKSDNQLNLFDQPVSNDSDKSSATGKVIHIKDFNIRRDNQLRKQIIERYKRG